MWEYRYNSNRTTVNVPDEWDGMTWEQRVEALQKSPDTPKRFDMPFPMGVFGTLRKGQGNNGLMHGGEVKKHQNAFLPHFIAHGLSVSCKVEGCAPFEIFHYEPSEWQKMIDRVDRLEGFHPESAHGRTNHNYYYRTLAWLRVLPEGHVSGFFPPNGRVSLSGERNMKIAPELWEQYERIPCWVYSNMGSNVASSHQKNSHIIWPMTASEEEDDLY